MTTARDTTALGRIVVVAGEDPREGEDQVPKGDRTDARSGSDNESERDETRKIYAEARERMVKRAAEATAVQ